MRLRPEQLEGKLQKQSWPIFLVSGDEPLLLQESCDLIRRHCREQGCTDRQVLHSDVSGFDWGELHACGASMSLFSERQLIELRIPNGKPGRDGSQALCDYVDLGVQDNVLLIIAGKIDKRSTNSKWFKALDGAGAVIQVWPVDARQLPAWLGQRISAAGLSIDEEALQLLADRVEGNLLAAMQEIEKLRLLGKDTHIDVAAITEAVANSARFDPFGLADTALNGKPEASLRVLRGLRAEGTEPTLILWSLGRDIRTLQQLQSACNQGQRVDQALRNLRVWDSRKSLMKAALARHSNSSLAELLELAVQADGSIKGFAAGKPWDNLEKLVIHMARPS